MISLVVAVDAEWGIGYNGDLLEHIPNDLKYFKTLTSGGTVIMGRKTWDSLPKKPLPNRYNIIITTHKEEDYDDVSYMSMDEVKTFLENVASTERVFVIGGGTIYKALLPYCSEAWVTKIFKKHENVDTYFPNLDADENWERDDEDLLTFNYEDFNYQFQHYSRV